jgi:hypothetical protein
MRCGPIARTCLWELRDEVMCPSDAGGDDLKGALPRHLLAAILSDHLASPGSILLSPYIFCQDETTGYFRCPEPYLAFGEPLAVGAA